jgi:PAS domain S-box-containing protein
VTLRRLCGPDGPWIGGRPGCHAFTAQGDSVSAPATPGLSDIEAIAEPGWLWDPERHRVLWANAAAIAFFGGDTLFDVVDRVFDPGEPAVAALSRIGEAGGEPVGATLHFPSLRGAPALAARCYPQQLDDGRPCLLVVGAGGSGADPNAALCAGAFEALPWAAVITDGDGNLLAFNREAQRLAGEDSEPVLATLIPVPEVEDLLGRTAAAGTATLTTMTATAFGRREIRFTARRFGRDDPPRYLIAFDDVTERRGLERLLAAGRRTATGRLHAPSPRLSDADARTFAYLGERIRRADPAPRAASADEAPPQADQARTALSLSPERVIPEIVRRTLDLSESAIVLFDNHRLLHANRAAAALLGYADFAGMQAREDLAAGLAGLTGESAELTTHDAAGRPVTVMAERSSFPSIAGPIAKVELSLLTPQSDFDEPAAAQIVSPRSESGPLPQVSEKSGPSADELRLILDTATDGIITLDTAGRILSFSAGAEAIFGYRQAEVHGRLLVELMDAESRKTVRDYLAALGEGGIASIFNDGREVSAIAAQGGKIPVFLTIGRMGTNGEARLRPGSAPAFCAVMRDITQWKKTEAELRRAKDEAEKASAQKSDFLARISHELRTPLNAILGFSEVMRSERFGEMRNPKYLAYANDIHTSGEHLLSLINDLLDLSKVEAGKLELNFTSVNLAELAEHCLKLMEEEARGRRVILRRNFAAGLPNVVADLRSMKQILLNLISNAIKFTAAGGQVIVSGQTRPSGEFVLRVKDTGVGIAPEALAIALTPFGRAHDDEHPEIGGTGLGLPLTKALAEANRARFEITSKPEKGTSVEIVFPVNRVLAG